MFGEDAHAAGADGVHKAKRWLESTTRVDARWIYPEEQSRNKLEYQWHGGSTFIFDIGGLFRGGDLDGRTFAAEVKNYTDAGAQGTLYTEYLARCYRARGINPGLTDQFMWITWHPFSVTKWSKLTTAAEVRSAVVQHSEKALGVPAEEAESAVDDSLCSQIAESLWLVVLSDKHELLMLSDLDRAAVVTAQMTRGA
ncbi:MAG: hypothetical protein QM598_04210 [Protaetiibacter sp.]